MLEMPRLGPESTDESRFEQEKAPEKAMYHGCHLSLEAGPALLLRRNLGRTRGAGFLVSVPDVALHCRFKSDSVPECSDDFERS